MKNNDGLNWEVSVGVTFASFMSAVTLFFTGIVIAQLNVFGITAKVPVLFLIVSTFSFIFSAAIYSNAGVEITNGKLGKVQKYLVYANNYFEFLGLHLLVLATPLAISSITHDSFLRFAIVLIALVALGSYSVSDFSILHKEIPSKAKKYSLILTILVLSVCLYITQYYAKTDTTLYNIIGSTVLLLHIILTLYFNSNSRQYKS